MTRRTIHACRGLTALLVAAGLALPGGQAFSQDKPVQTSVGSGLISNAGELPANIRGGVFPSPVPEVSEINNYLFQDEQLNLDPNAGNVRVLRTDEKFELNDYVTGLFPLTQVPPRELRNVFRSIMALEGGTAEVIRDKTTGQDFLYVVAPMFVMPYVEAAVAELDVPWLREYDSGSADVYYKALNRGAAEVDFIARRWGSSDNGFSEIDVTNNAVSRLDEPYRIASYLKGAEIVDIPANQVLLEVEIYEVNTQNDLKLGLDYINWKNGPGRNLFQFVYQELDADSDNDFFTSVFDPFGAVDPNVSVGEGFELETDITQYYTAVNYLLPSNYIDFLQVKGIARLVREQTLQVKSANTAFISAEDQIVALVSEPNDLDEITPDELPGVTTIEAPRARRGDDDEIVVETVPVRDTTRRLRNEPVGTTGIFVEMTPFVGLESMELVVDIDIRDLKGVSPSGTPIIAERELSSTVRLIDGEPYVIGGLTRTNDIRETAKMPILGSIPIIGYLFGGETDVQRKTQVLVVVTPHFHLSSQVDLGLTADAVDIKTKVLREDADPDIPDNDYFFDQYLLGGL